MESQIERIAYLALIDRDLDELEEEYGDLPQQLKELEDKQNKAQAMVDETRGILNEIKDFCATSKVTLVELKDKEEKLVKQQFLVRNNKEFDAITSEIDHLRKEHESLSDRLRTEGVKQDNLNAILMKQTAELEASNNEVEEKKKEIEHLSSDQNDELIELRKKREVIIQDIDADYLHEYSRVRGHISEAAVFIKRNSCSGCFSAVPPQKIVEIRNNLDKIYYCENCGRMLIPEEVEINEAELDMLVE